MELRNFCEVCGASHVSIAWYVAGGKSGKQPRRYICSEQYFKARSPSASARQTAPVCEDCQRPMAEISNPTIGDSITGPETRTLWLCLECGATKRLPEQSNQPEI